MFILSYANVLYIYPKLCLQVDSAFWLRTYLTNQCVILRYFSSNLFKWNYWYGDLPFFKIQVNHFMAQDELFGGKDYHKMHLMGEGPGAILSLKTFLSFINRLISSVQSLSCVWLFATPWIAACQASVFITNSRSSLRLTSIESVMPYSHLILCRPLLFLPPIPPKIRVFSNESALHRRWPKYWSFSFSIIPSKEIPGLIAFRMDLQGTLWMSCYVHCCVNSYMTVSFISLS